MNIFENLQKRAALKSNYSRPITKSSSAMNMNWRAKNRLTT